MPSGLSESDGASAAGDEKVDASKKGWPVSKALAAVPTVTVAARLL